MTALRNELTPQEYEKQAQAGEPEKGRWSMTEQLLAGVVDSLRNLEYILVLANSDGKGRKPKKPEPMRRPGVTGQEKKKAEPMSEQSAAWLFQLINGSAA